MACIYEPNWNCFGFNSMKSYTQLYRPTNNDMQVYRIHTRSVKVFIFYK